MQITFAKAREFSLRMVAALPMRPRMRVLSGRCGLFSDVLIALSSIQVLQRHGLSGTVDWGRRSLYFDPNIGGNAYEYFFRGATFGDTRGALRRRFSIPYIPPGDPYIGPPGVRPREHLKVMIDNYAIPREDITREVEDFRRQRLGAGKILGVHVRRTDVLAGAEDRRAQPVENFVDAAELWLSENKPAVVFLATDDANVVDQFRARLRDSVVVQDAIRSADGTSLHGHKDKGTTGSPFRKGREALIDALILAQSTFLIRSFSFLTAYSLCSNPNLPFLDLDKKNLGVVRTPWLHQ